MLTGINTAWQTGRGDKESWCGVQEELTMVLGCVLRSALRNGSNVRGKLDLAPNN